MILLVLLPVGWLALGAAFYTLPRAYWSMTWRELVTDSVWWPLNREPSWQR